MSPAATSARIRVEETVSPSTSTRGTTRVSNSERAGEHLRVALAPWRRSGSSRRPRPARRRAARSAPPRRTPRRCAEANSRSKGITTSSRTPRPSITSRFTPKGMISFGSAAGCRISSGCGIEGEDGVGVVDHRLVAAVDAVEGADRDVARPRLGVGKRGDLDAHQSSQSHPPLAGTSSATCSEVSSVAGVLDPERADRGAAQLRAVGVVEGLDQGADVGAGRALDLVRRRSRASLPSSSAR